MSVSATWSVWCDGDGCAEWQGSERSSTKARKDAKAAGWVRRVVNGRLVDLCPRCAEDQS